MAASTTVLGKGQPDTHLAFLQYPHIRDVDAAITRCMTDGRELRIFRDGRRERSYTTLQLPPGSQGNLITLGVMRRIVREDASYPDLGNFIRREIIGIDNTEPASEIETAFTFCRDQIAYLPESPTTETVADLWSCLYGLNRLHPVGDCAVKCVALATVLAHLGHKPYFIAIKQVPRADYFNHVYIGVMVDGSEISLDPTPESFNVGDQLGSWAQLRYRIFD